MDEQRVRPLVCGLPDRVDYATTLVPLEDHVGDAAVGKVAAHRLAEPSSQHGMIGDRKAQPEPVRAAEHALERRELGLVLRRRRRACHGRHRSISRRSGLRPYQLPFSPRYAKT